MRRLIFLGILLPLLGVFLSHPVAAGMHEPLNTGTVPSSELPRNLRQVSITQKLGAQVPLTLEFRDELGRHVRLAELIHDKPVILTLAYFKCPSLCTFVLNGVVDAIKELPETLGRDFQVLTVSINPKEGPSLALAKKRSYLARYGKAPVIDDSPGWRMLTGQEREIRALADSVGFHYAYDARSGQYSHASVAMILTPEGKVSQYLFGIKYPSQDVSKALKKASASAIGSAIPAVLLYCFHYDPSTGTWSLKIMNILRVMGVFTLLLVSGFLIVTFRKERVA